MRLFNLQFLCAKILHLQRGTARRLGVVDASLFKNNLQHVNNTGEAYED
jgi:hypothetical protein